MKVIHTRSHLGPDGILELKLPTGIAESDVEVVVIVNPLGRNGEDPAKAREEWLRFILDTAGSIQDPTFLRHEQGEFDRQAELP